MDLQYRRELQELCQEIRASGGPDIDCRGPNEVLQDYVDANNWRTVQHDYENVLKDAIDYYQDLEIIDYPATNQKILPTLQPIYQQYIRNPPRMIKYPSPEIYSDLTDLPLVFNNIPNYLRQNVGIDRLVMRSGTTSPPESPEAIDFGIPRLQEITLMDPTSYEIVLALNAMQWHTHPDDLTTEVIEQLNDGTVVATFNFQ